MGHTGWALGGGHVSDRTLFGSSAPGGKNNTGDSNSVKRRDILSPPMLPRGVIVGIWGGLEGSITFAAREQVRSFRREVKSQLQVPLGAQFKINAAIRI